MKSIRTTGPAVLFLVALWLPMVQMLFPFVEEPANTEHRELAALTDSNPYNLKGLKQTARELKNYLNDNLGFRRLLIQWNSIMRIEYFRMASVGNVIIGKEGWLYYNHPTDGAGIRDFEGGVPFSRQQLETIRLNLQDMHDSLSKRGIHFVVLVMPNKQTIYPEYLPGDILQRAGATRLDQVATYLNERPGVNFLDIRSELLEKKAVFPVYQRTDTHVTEFGAFLAYNAIMRSLQKSVPGIEVLGWDDMTAQTHVVPGNGDLADMIALPGRYEEHAVEVKPKRGFQARNVSNDRGGKGWGSISIFENSESSAAKLLLYGDSFAEYLIPYLSESFSRTVSIRKYAIDYPFIERERPGVVMLQICERYLEKLLDERVAPPQKATGIDDSNINITTS